MFPQSTIDHVLEIRVLGYFITTKETNFQLLVPQDFSHTVHRKIFQDILADTVFSYEKLLSFGLSEKSALDLYETTIYTTAELEKSARQLRQMTLARKKFYEAHVLCQKITQSTPSELGSVVGDVNIKDSTYNASKVREKLKFESLPDPVYFEPKSINENLEYFSPGWVCAIAASTGVGKTSAAIQISRSIADFENSVSLYISLEMPLVSYLERALTLKFYESPDHDWISWQRFRKNLTMQILSDNAVSEREIVIDKPGMSVYEIREQARKILASGVNLKTIVIDHFHLVKSNSLKIDENASQASTIAEIDAMAKDLNVRVLLVLQTRKKSGDNRFEEPYDSDIHGSKSIINQLWWILMLWRDKENQDVIKWKIAKRRDGRGVGNTGVISIRGTYMYDEYMSFSETVGIK